MKVGGTYWGGRWGLSGEEGGDLLGRKDSRTKRETEGSRDISIHVRNCQRANFKIRAKF